MVSLKRQRALLGAKATFLSSFEHLSQEYQDERVLLPLLSDFCAASFPLSYFHIKFHIKYENTKLYKIKEVFIVAHIDSPKFTV